MLFVQTACAKLRCESSPLERSLKGFCLRKKSVLWQLRNAPLTVPLNVYFNYSEVLNCVTFCYVVDTYILVNVLVLFSFYTSAISLVETERDIHMAVFMPISDYLVIV